MKESSLNPVPRKRLRALSLAPAKLGVGYVLQSSNNKVSSALNVSLFHQKIVKFLCSCQS